MIRLLPLLLLFSGCAMDGAPVVSQVGPLVTCCAVLLDSSVATPEKVKRTCTGDICPQSILDTPATISLPVVPSLVVASAASGEDAITKTGPQTTPSQPEIVIYTRKDCPACDRLQHELRLRGLKFSLNDADANASAPYGSVDGTNCRGNGFYRLLDIPIPGEKK